MQGHVLVQEAGVLTSSSIATDTPFMSSRFYELMSLSRWSPGANLQLPAGAWLQEAAAASCSPGGAEQIS